MILCLFMKVECQRRSSLLRVDPLVGRQALNRLLQQDHMMRMNMRVTMMMTEENDYQSDVLAFTIHSLAVKAQLIIISASTMLNLLQQKCHILCF